MRLTGWLLRLYRIPLLGHLARQLVFLFGADIPRSVRWGDRFVLLHRGLGSVIHPATRFGSQVAVHQGVTIGEADIGRTDPFGGVSVGSRVVLGAGAKVLAPRQGLHVADGTILAANSVLLCSTTAWGVYGGIPARRISDNPYRPSAEHFVVDGVDGAGSGSGCEP